MMGNSGLDPNLSALAALAALEHLESLLVFALVHLFSESPLGIVLRLGLLALLCLAAAHFWGST